MSARRTGCGLWLAFATVTGVAGYLRLPGRPRITYTLEQVAVDRLHGRHHCTRHRLGREGVAGEIEVLERVGIRSRVAVAELTANAKRLGEALHHRDDLAER